MKPGAIEESMRVSDLEPNTMSLFPQECGMRMDTEWVDIVRHTSLDNSKRTDYSSQTLRIEKKMSHLLFHAYLIQHLKLKMHCIMKNCHQQEERFFVFMEQFEVLEALTVGAAM